LVHVAATPTIAECVTPSADVVDVTPKRIALIALPALTKDLVRRACLADGTIEIDVTIDSVAELCTELTHRRLDAVIAGATPGEMSPIPLAALQLQPTLRVLLITARDGVSELFELLPRRTRLGDLTPTEIIRAVRDDGAHATAWSGLGDDESRTRAEERH
jgi:hypothetical protein